MIAKFHIIIKRSSFLSKAIFVTFFMFFIVVSNVFIIYKKVVFNKKLIAKEIVLRSEFEKKQQLSDLKFYQNEINHLKNEYNSLLKFLINDNELSSLINDISQAGIAKGLIFELFSPIKRDEKQLYTESSINLSVIGEYQHLIGFLLQLSDFNPVISLHDFDLYPILDKADNHYLGESQNFLRLKMTIKIYQRNKYSHEI